MRPQAGTNLPKVGSYNQNVVLDTIRSAGAISRVELAGRTGLTAQTISVIVRRLLDGGLVREDGARPPAGPAGGARGGKPRTQLRVEAAAGYAVGVHFDPVRISAKLVDLSGHSVADARYEIHESVKPEAAAALMAKAVRKVVRDGRIPPKRILGVGLACPGPIDQDRGLVLYPPQLSGWERVPLERLLCESTGYDVVLDNDATAAAIGERWSGLAMATGNFVYVYMGTGIGGGLFLSNQVYRGPFRNAAEIGHVMVERDGPECYCGNRGCLEAVARPSAMVAEAHDLLAKSDSGAGAQAGATVDGGGVSALAADFARDPRLVDHAALCAAAAQGDPLARRVVDRVAGHLADVAVDLANILDIELIVLGGPALGPVGEIYRAAAAEAVTKRAMARRIHQTAVRLSRTGGDAGAIGAASLVFHRAFAPQVTELLSS
jgi:predicted NBD/HSP70 family sugar kinase